jgi:DNA-binding transcriptional ArsR family regulator
VRPVGLVVSWVGSFRCIDYRRLSMDVDRDSAEVWAGWFRALGDASRVLILNRLATAGRPMSVGEIVDAVDVGQSTVSHHLKLLFDTGFVHVERQGNASLYRVNERCLDVFPSAAEVVMGRLPRYDPLPGACAAPWQTQPNGADARDSQNQQRQETS